jgi:GNAT superfamily N-acetyltransferase
MSDALEGLDIGPYRPDEEAAILTCLGTAFGFEPQPAKWRHLYLENPAGEPIIVLARDRDTVVGHVGILPHRIRAFGEDAIAGHSIDGCVHPSWRRRGLRVALGAEAKVIARARGFVATYGVSNEQATHGILKYEDRTYIGQLPVMVRPLRPLATGVGMARRLLAPVLGVRPAAETRRDVDVDCAVVGPIADDGRLAAAAAACPGTWAPAAFDHRHTRLFQDAEGVPTIAIVRDAAYLAWRYRAGAPAPYWQQDAPAPDGLAATVVIRAAELAGLRFVFLMEWHWRGGAVGAGRGLAQAAMSLARAIGADGVAAMANPGTPQRRALGQLGFVPVPQWLFPKTSLMSVRPERKDANAPGWIQGRNWYLTWGDGLIL